jgi:hypothetical protein
LKEEFKEHMLEEDMKNKTGLFKDTQSLISQKAPKSLVDEAFEEEINSRLE